jgi:hypothetical protein
MFMLDVYVDSFYNFLTQGGLLFCRVYECEQLGLHVGYNKREELRFARASGNMTNYDRIMKTIECHQCGSAAHKFMFCPAVSFLPSAFATFARLSAMFANLFAMFAMYLPAMWNNAKNEHIIIIIIMINNKTNSSNNTRPCACPSNARSSHG